MYEKNTIVENIYNWERLEKENSGILSSLIQKWEDLIHQNLKEGVYNQFIKDDAGFFFYDFNCYLTISKLKLGNEYESDFVNIRD